MKFSGVKCFAIFLAFVSLALAEQDTTKELKLNATGGAEDGGRFIKKKIIPCISASGGTGTGTGVDTSGLTGIFSMFTTFFTSLTDMFDFELPDLSSLTSSFPNIDINSLASVDKDKLALQKFWAWKIPAIFFLSVIVGIIGAAIAIGVGSKFQSVDQMMNSMIDGVSNFMQQALNDVPAQYGIPTQDYSQGYAQQGYSQQQQQGGYPQQDSGYSGGYPAPAPSTSYGAPSTSYGSPSATYDTSSFKQAAAAPAAASFDSSSYQAPGGPASFDSSSYQAPGAPAATPDASYSSPQQGNPQSFNSPSNAYPDQSTQYGTPHRRYNYPSLSTNYLRSEKSRK